MEINIKEGALKQLSTISFKEDEGIRILAEFVGTCSIATEIELHKETQMEDDIVIEQEGFLFFVPNQSLESLPEKINLDYKPGMGYKIYSDMETFGYSFQLKE
ncbi:iron-sulfur cluster biosynthesis family protein [Oceanobacillus piezotolerans]|uniref:Iron-sulfur cluster biosynthesis family protein n=1 Tax=Oceanobacillus piezotolerans TaxID=2448030 RepID=A0A498DD30_9BACI|nr:iron-sulfur cluster biosynthesis family protein [Oceanobacillus piezotolerans]RLL46570.1 iron-sulfur cluster biosynthesis family protein [Oceanobacillus piezotolerans]